jgi:hypothetical protein
MSALARPLQAGLLRVLHAGYEASLLPSWARFRAAAARPEQAQAERLTLLLRTNAQTAFGRRFGFDRIDSVRAYQSSVPICRFDAMTPWVRRVAHGEPNVLTREPVRMMEATSGSTSANKYLPFTDGLLREIGAATHPWLFDLLHRCPGLAGTRSYWAISPVTRSGQTTPGGIPIGIEDDIEYFGPLARWVLGSMMAVPPGVARIADVDRWRWETSRHLLQADDLGLLSVWSPTFAIRLMECIEKDLDSLLASLPPPRAAQIRRRLDRSGTLTGEALWPRLAVVSSWADGPSRAFLPSLRRWFPKTPLQPKGLLATEGVVSFPLWGQEGSVLAVAGHFLEFVDAQHPTRTPLLAHELREGMLVSPVLTTSGGLYRYHLQDVVRCLGKYEAVARVRFEGRLDCVSDLVGEKLDARVVGRALERGARTTDTQWDFAMLAPALGPPPSYTLYLEGACPAADGTRMASRVEHFLMQGAHYAYCRKIGQLGPVHAVAVQGAARALERRRIAEGGRLGELKPSPLDRRTGWDSFFATGDQDPARSSRVTTNTSQEPPPESSRDKDDRHLQPSLPRISTR